MCAIDRDCLEVYAYFELSAEEYIRATGPRWLSIQELNKLRAFLSPLDYPDPKINLLPDNLARLILTRIELKPNSYILQLHDIKPHELDKFQLREQDQKLRTRLRSLHSLDYL